MDETGGSSTERGPVRTNDVFGDPIPAFESLQDKHLVRRLDADLEGRGSCIVSRCCRCEYHARNIMDDFNAKCTECQHSICPSCLMRVTNKWDVYKPLEVAMKAFGFNPDDMPDQEQQRADDIPREVFEDSDSDLVTHILADADARPGRLPGRSAARTSTSGPAVEKGRGVGTEKDDEDNAIPWLQDMAALQQERDASLTAKWESRFFDTQELVDSGVMNARAQIASDLSNEIHPLFAFRHWTDCRQDLWDDMAPALRLASKWLTHVSSMQFWVQIFRGQRRLHRCTRKDPGAPGETECWIVESPSFDVRKTISTRKKLQALGEELDWIAYTWESDDRYSSFSDHGQRAHNLVPCRRRVSPMAPRKAPDTETFDNWTGVDRRHLRPDGADIRVDRSFKNFLLRARWDPEIGENERLCFNLHFASVLLHNIAHAVERFATYDAYHDAGVEPVLGHISEPMMAPDEHCEVGDVWERRYIGGPVEAVSNDPFYKSGLYMVDIGSYEEQSPDSTFHEARGIPMGSLSPIQQELYWKGLPTTHFFGTALPQMNRVEAKCKKSRLVLSAEKRGVEKKAIDPEAARRMKECVAQAFDEGSKHEKPRPYRASPPSITILQFPHLSSADRERLRTIAEANWEHCVVDAVTMTTTFLKRVPIDELPRLPQAGDTDAVVDRICKNALRFAKSMNEHYERIVKRTEEEADGVSPIYAPRPTTSEVIERDLTAADLSDDKYKVAQFLDRAVTFRLNDTFLSRFGKETEESPAGRAFAVNRLESRAQDGEAPIAVGLLQVPATAVFPGPSWRPQGMYSPTIDVQNQDMKPKIGRSLTLVQRRNTLLKQATSNAHKTVTRVAQPAGSNKRYTWHHAGDDLILETQRSPAGEPGAPNQQRLDGDSFKLVPKAARNKIVNFEDEELTEARQGYSSRPNQVARKQRPKSFNLADDQTLTTDLNTPAESLASSNESQQPLSAKAKESNFGVVVSDRAEGALVGEQPGSPTRKPPLAPDSDSDSNSNESDGRES